MPKVPIEKPASAKRNKIQQQVMRIEQFLARVEH